MAINELLLLVNKLDELSRRVRNLESIDKMAVLVGQDQFDTGVTPDNDIVVKPITVSGATVDDLCLISHTGLLAKEWVLYANVSAVDTVTVRALNKTGGNDSLTGDVIVYVVR